MAEKRSFVRVKCPDCENSQVMFLYASTRVPCQVCGTTLAEPTGGRANIKGTVEEYLS